MARSAKEVALEIESQLPSARLAETGMNSIYSDHLPKLNTLALDSERTIKLLSYNTLSGWAFQGFVSDRAETREQETARHLRISNFIVEAHQTHGLDLIALQETTTEHAQQIRENLGQEWGLSFSENGQALIYRISQFDIRTPLTRPTTVSGYLRNQDFSATLLIHRDSGKRIAVFPVHIPHQDSPGEAEQALVAINTEFSKSNDLVIFAGDFNRRIANTSTSLMDNANNLIPLAFRDGDLGTRIYDYTDGCFVFRGKALSFCNGITLCPAYPDSEMRRRNSLGEQPYEEDLIYAPVMFSETHHLPVVGIENGTSISAATLQAALREKNQDDTLDIQVYASRFNQKKIVIKSKNKISELDAIGIESITRDARKEYELTFDYAELENQNNQLGFRVLTPTGSQLLPLSSLISPSSSLLLNVGLGVLTVLSGIALAVGALAIAGLIAVIAPEIGMAMIVTTCVVDLVVGIGFFANSAEKDNDALVNKPLSMSPL